MSKSKPATIEVQGTAITVIAKEHGDYISLTDMVRNFEGGSALIEQRLKNKDTVLFLGVWERIHNLDFNSLEFEEIRNEAGRNSFFLSAKSWAERTRAKGLVASAGRYGGTFAHTDIAFEFGSWLSQEFKLYLIKEFQRLKLMLNEIMLRHTGQSLEKIEKDTDRDNFMSAVESQEYGLIDNVLERLPIKPVT